MAKQRDGSDQILILKRELRDNIIRPLYIFHGEETFLMTHYLQQMKKRLLDELTESFNFHKLTNENFSLQSFVNCVENLPMMAEHTFVWVDEVDLFKLAEPDRNQMMEILSDIPEYCSVVFTYVTVPWKPDRRLTNYWKTIEKHAFIVEFDKQDQQDLIPWIQRHFASHKKRITPDLCHYLIEMTGGTMTALRGEISKIAAYSGADNITRSDIDAVTEPVMDAVVFQMTDAIGRGEYGQAITKLRTLLKMQEEAVVILGAIAGHFRRLSTAKTLADNGKGIAEFMGLTGLKEYPARKTMSAAAGFKSEFYRKAAWLMLDADRKIKTSYDDVQRILEVLILQLAQEARNG